MQEEKANATLHRAGETALTLHENDWQGGEVVWPRGRVGDRGSEPCYQDKEWNKNQSVFSSCCVLFHSSFWLPLFSPCEVSQHHPVEGDTRRSALKLNTRTWNIRQDDEFQSYWEIPLLRASQRTFSQGTFRSYFPPYKLNTLSYNEGWRIEEVCVRMQDKMSSSHSQNNISEHSVRSNLATHRGLSARQSFRRTQWTLPNTLFHCETSLIHH